MSPHRLAGAGAVGTALAIWFSIGYLADGGGSDHLVRIPQMHRGIEVMLGLALTASVGWAVLHLQRHHSPWLRRGWGFVYGELGAACACAAAGARVITAGGSGANIGGGIVLMYGPLPLLLLLEGARNRVTEAVGASGHRPKVIEAFAIALVVGWALLVVGAYRCGIC